MKKILSLLLVLTMVFSLSSTSFAAAGDSVPASGEEEIDKYTYSLEKSNDYNTDMMKHWISGVVNIGSKNVELRWEEP